MTAQDILRKSAQHIEDRAAARDQAQGERSMARTVAAFNAITGHQLTERDGWLFMVQLKAARATTTPTGIPDDYEDGASYFALAGECAAGNDNAPATKSARDCVVEVPIMGGNRLVVPVGYDWIAQDSNGAWWAYNFEPSPGNVSWVAADSMPENADASRLSSPTQYGNEFWRDTLRKVRA